MITKKRLRKCGIKDCKEYFLPGTVICIYDAAEATLVNEGDNCRYFLPPKKAEKATLEAQSEQTPSGRATIPHVTIRFPPMNIGRKGVRR